MRDFRAQRFKKVEAKAQIFYYMKDYDFRFLYTSEALRHLLFGIWDMFLHVVQCTLCDSLLENKIFELMPVAVIFDTSSDFTEAVQKHFVICTVLLIIP